MKNFHIELSSPFKRGMLVRIASQEEIESDPAGIYEFDYEYLFESRHAALNCDINLSILNATLNNISPAIVLESDSYFMKILTQSGLTGWTRSIYWRIIK